MQTRVSMALFCFESNAYSENSASALLSERCINNEVEFNQSTVDLVIQHQHEHDQHIHTCLTGI